MEPLEAHVLFVGRDGRFAVGVIDEIDGKYVQTQSDSGMAPGWTHVVAVGPHILFVRKKDGRFAVGHIDLSKGHFVATQDGTLVDPKSSTVFTGAAHVVAGRNGLVFAFRFGELATWRLLATRPARADHAAFGQPGPPVSAAELQGMLDEAGLRARIAELAWSSRVRLQHRVAERFRRGRLYLVGDAAHAYSPATGQGMNAAIQDGANLGWKLALAGPGPGGAELLGSYELERRPVARRVLALTHLVFWGEASTGRLPSALRGGLAPLAAPLVPALIGRRRVQQAYRLLELALRAVQLEDAGVGDTRRGQLAGKALELGAHGIDVEQFLAAQQPHGSALVRHHYHQVLGLQLAQRLPDRRAADREPLTQLLLRQPRPGRVAAVEDGRLQPERDLVRQARDDDRLRGHAHILSIYMDPIFASACGTRWRSCRS